jgi:hypothetical protein
MHGGVFEMRASVFAWVNRGKEVCRLLFVVMDAKS